MIQRSFLEQVLILSHFCYYSGSPLMKNMYIEPFEKREEPLQFLGLLKTGISQNSNVPAAKVKSLLIF